MVVGSAQLFGIDRPETPVSRRACEQRHPLRRARPTRRRELMIDKKAVPECAAFQLRELREIGDTGTVVLIGLETLR
jgi:hypothetical protein